jgi:predicted adenylyl cyclase CyaB
LSSTGAGSPRQAGFSSREQCLETIVRNIDIKARVKSFAGIERRLAALGATLHTDERQVDTYFRVPRGRLKLRVRAGHDSELVYYRRGERGSKRVSDYSLWPVAAPRELERILTAAMGAKAVVAKHREVYLYRNARVHLDQVTGLGRFIEIEVLITKGRRQANELLERLVSEFDIEGGSMIRGSYSDLVIGTTSR